MTLGTDRRSVLTGLGALALAGCAREPAGAPAPGRRPTIEPLDFSALEARYGGRIGYVALNVLDGRTLAWRGDERFVYCSTFKMFLAAATLVRIQDGRETFQRQIPVTADDMIAHAPVTGPAVGSSLSVDRLMQAVVEVSDNPAANLLLKAGGGLAAMQAFYRSLGDDLTRVDRFEPEMNRLDGDKDTTTPLAATANLRRLFISANSPLASESQTRLLRWMLDSPTGADRLKGGVPQGWRVAHKTGTGGYGPTNDIGLIYPPASPPVIAAAYYHAPEASPAATNDAVIAEATRMALRALGHNVAA